MKQYHRIGGFSERLEEAIFAKDMDLTLLAKRIGVARSNLYGWLHYDTTPESYWVMKLSLELNVSADWLLGISEKKELVR